jgi:hypothetical protein
MKSIIKAALLAVITTLALAGTSTAATPVTNLGAPFGASNSTVTLTPDGVHFGTYADAGLLGGSLYFHGLDGLTLADVTDYSYSFTYRQRGDTTGAAPYARIFLDADTAVDSDGDGNPANDIDDDVVLDPSFCATTEPAQATELTYQMVGNQVRYDDDGCDGVAPDDQPWDDVVAAHGDETIVAFVVSQGFSTGEDVSGLLRQITVNGTTYAFGAPQAGPQGPVGPQGPTGATGGAGSQGATGAPGAAGTPGARGPAGPAGPAGASGSNGVSAQGGTSCKGSGTRILHVPSRKGWTLVKAVASLRGKKLPVKGRTITVKLPQVEGNYNIKITALYGKKDGRSLMVHQSRNLSVACA